MSAARILVVDDDLDIRELVGRCLKLEGMDVSLSSSAQEALGYARTERFDLMIVDVMMEGKDGFQLVKQLREEDDQTPVIFLTSRAGEFDKILGLSIGADDYITKAFSPGELVARIRALLRRIARAQDRKSLLRHGPFLLDLDSGEATREGQKLDLTSTEFKLLRVFMENPGRVFSREQLYHRVRERVEYFDDSVIQVHVSRLREKIEPEPREPAWLLTVRGLGYRFANAPEGAV